MVCLVKSPKELELGIEGEVFKIITIRDIDKLAHYIDHVLRMFRQGRIEKVNFIFDIRIGRGEIIIRLKEELTEEYKERVLEAIEVIALSRKKSKCFKVIVQFE